MKIRRSAFTLIELMVVVAIIAIIMTIAIPFVHTAIGNGRGMNKAVKDIQERCSDVRAMAILQQTVAELRIRPADGIFEVGAAAAPSTTETFSPDVSGREWRMPSRGSSGTASGSSSSSSSKLPDGIRIEGLGVNGEDWTEDEVAHVRFYPNGTSDAMSVVLLSDDNERRNIWLEVVTGLPEVETDPHRFRAR